MMTRNLFKRLLLCLFFSLIAGVSMPSLGAPETAKPATEALPLQDLRIFAEVFNRIKSDYVENISDKELLQYAIRGMLSGLDPHSAFLSGEEFKELKVGTSGEFGGLGIEVGLEDGLVKIIAPIDDSPAQRAGLQTGDLIVRLDDKPVKGMNLNEAVNLMRGVPGSAVSLIIVREGIEKPFLVKLNRDIIRIASIKSRLLEPGFGYVRISQFQGRTNDDLIAAVTGLKNESKDGLKGLILDLRNNPGGVLNAAVAVSDAFLESGLIVYTEGRNSEAHLEFKAGPDDILNGAPLVVLVNGGSASASEIVAGALQDHKRALIVGEATFGKGSVQSVIPVDDNNALKLTTARYFTPSGRSIQAAGIAPDIMLNHVKVKSAEETALKPIKEADLSRHLDGSTPERAAESSHSKTPANQSNKTGANNASKDSAKSLVESDFQLNEALNLLKGMVIFGQTRKG